MSESDTVIATATDNRKYIEGNTDIVAKQEILTSRTTTDNNEKFSIFDHDDLVKSDVKWLQQCNNDEQPKISARLQGQRQSSCSL